MADSLDNFFAKKDKKKSKDKGKSVLSAEALVRELEEGFKHLDYPQRKEKTSAAIDILGLDADDGNWRDYDEIEKRDYSGLKLKEASLQGQAEEEQRRLANEVVEPVIESTPWKLKDDQPATSQSTANSQASKIKDGEQATKSDTNQVSGSTDNTNKQDQANKTDTPDAAESSSSDKKPEEKSDKPSAKAVYIPPSQKAAMEERARLQQQQQQTTVDGVKILEPIKLGPRPGRIGGARQGPIPNIQDTQAFPSLG